MKEEGKARQNGGSATDERDEGDELRHRISCDTRCITMEEASLSNGASKTGAVQRNRNERDTSCKASHLATEERSLSSGDCGWRRCDDSANNGEGA
ncbi:uncharacterized protein DS421_5g140780 [Arachis hypogaea]|nr:uncharacterized protein DS421_5g140780 [Arachis hypogaea]